MGECVGHSFLGWFSSKIGSFSNVRKMFVWECARKKFRDHSMLYRLLENIEICHNYNQIHWDVKKSFHRRDRVCISLLGLPQQSTTD